MNKVILVGNLASDVETRTTNSGNIAAHFRIAVDRIREGRDGQRETDFFPSSHGAKQPDCVPAISPRGARSPSTEDCRRAPLTPRMAPSDI